MCQLSGFLKWISTTFSKELQMIFFAKSQTEQCWGNRQLYLIKLKKKKNPSVRNSREKFGPKTDWGKYTDSTNPLRTVELGFLCLLIQRFPSLPKLWVLVYLWGYLKIFIKYITGWCLWERERFFPLCCTINLAPSLEIQNLTYPLLLYFSTRIIQKIKGWTCGKCEN